MRPAAALTLSLLVIALPPAVRRGAASARAVQTHVATRAAMDTPGDPLLVGSSTAVRNQWTTMLYGNGRLTKGWRDYSWAPHTLDAPSPAGLPGRALRVTFNPWSGLYLHPDKPLDVRGGGYIQLTLNGGDAGGQNLALTLQYGPHNTSGRHVPLASLLPRGIVPARAWVTVRVDIEDSLPAGEELRGVVLQEWSGKRQPTMYVGDVTLSAAGIGRLATSAAALTVRVDASSGRHPISPYIYGLAGSEGDSYLRTLRPTLLRWGGVTATRFNWRIGHAWDAGRYSLYHNENYARTNGSASDGFVMGAKRAGAATLLTIPTIGWVAKDTASFSFPGKHGEPTDGEGSSCTNPLIRADPHRTSIQVGPSFMQDWVRHLQVERAGVRFFAMDNEPDLWGVTHYDIHPTCTGYDEIFREFTTYASAVKSVAPHSMVTGPVSCCWQTYFSSMLGDVDRLRHDNLGFLPWFLQSMRSYDLHSHRRTLDVLDIHYAPEDLTADDADRATAAWRLQETRSLWDPTYVDHSSIAQPVLLIPRMTDLIARYYPGTRLGISSWNWGAEGTLNGGLAVADVLGIYGEQGLYLSANWNYPPTGSPAALAFQMFRNYDGHGAAFGETSVRATSSNRNRLSVYASLRRRDGHLLILFINKMPRTNAATQVDLHGFSGRQARAYRVDAGNIHAVAPLGVMALYTHTRLTLPPYSLTLLDVAPR